MELKFNEKYLIAVLREFNGLLLKCGYQGPNVNYNERDGDSVTYTGRAKQNKRFEVFIWYGLGKLIILIKKPDNSIKVLFKILYLIFCAFFLPRLYRKLKLSSGWLTINLTEKMREMVGPEKFEDILTVETYEEVIKQHRIFIEQNFLAIIKGESWVK